MNQLELPEERRAEIIRLLDILIVEAKKLHSIIDDIGRQLEEAKINGTVPER